MPLAIAPLLPAGLYTAPTLAVEQSRPVVALPRAPSLACVQPCTSSTAPQVVQPPSAAAAAAATGQLGLPPAAAQLTIPAAKEKEPLMDTLKRAGQKALGGGVPGAAAMAVQVRRRAGPSGGGWAAAGAVLPGPRLPVFHWPAHPAVVPWRCRRRRCVR